MGIYFTDKYSLLHFATGIISYYWNISFWNFFILHFIYEYVENTETGMRYINYISFWPGGKDHADLMINRIGDQVYGLFGWIFAYWICNM